MTTMAGLAMLVELVEKDATPIGAPRVSAKSPTR